MGDLLHRRRPPPHHRRPPVRKGLHIRIPVKDITVFNHSDIEQSIQVSAPNNANLSEVITMNKVKNLRNNTDLALSFHIYKTNDVYISYAHIISYNHGPRSYKLGLVQQSPASNALYNSFTTQSTPVIPPLTCAVNNETTGQIINVTLSASNGMLILTSPSN